MSGPITRSNRSRVHVENPLRGRSRHGCWTCRIRRKKCDEQRADAGLCGNCSRLHIDCVGWGERRPEWTKDPAQLNAFKATMKAQIHRQIRAISDPIPNIPSPGSPAPADGPASAHPSPSKESTREEMLMSLPHLTLPNSLIRPLTSGALDPYNYRVFVEHVRILANASDLPHAFYLAFAEVASLGEWKHDELDRGCLSYRELARRATSLENIIEKDLKEAWELHRQTSASSVVATVRHTKQEDMLQFLIFADDEESHTSHASSDLLPDLDGHGLMAISIASTRSTGSKGDIKVKTLSPLEVAAQAESSAPEPASLVPYLSGLLFLHSIVSGLNQKVPEIVSTTERMIRILIAGGSVERLPKMQRLLAAALVSCLSNNELAASLFSNALATIDDHEIACNSAVTLAQRGREVDYED